MNKRKILVNESRTYIFTEKDLKEKLRLDGTIIRMELFSGLSPKMEEDKVSTDVQRWRIITEKFYEEKRENYVKKE